MISIEFMTDTVVEEVHDPSAKEVTGLRLRNVKTDKVFDFPTSAMFLGIGHTPNADFVGDQLKRDGEGYIIPVRLCLHQRTRSVRVG